MSIPEGYLPRKGDVVVVHAYVQYDVTDSDNLKVFVRPLEAYTDVRIPVSTLVGIFSRHFDEGTRVRPIVEPSVSGTVVATCDDRVWVKFDATETIPEHFETYRSENLELIPDPVEKPFVEPEAAPATPQKRFGIGETVTLARLPEDPERAGDIKPFIGRHVEITDREGQLYKVRPAGEILEFFASDDMLVEIPF